MLQGKIIKGIWGFYYVDTENGVYECRARGIFRKDKITPLVGDRVKISIVDEESKKGVVEEIDKRDTELIRPPIANVDKALIVFAVKNPRPHLSLLDRFIVLAEKENLEIVIVLTKADLDDDNTLEKITSIYELSGYKVIPVSNKNKLESFLTSIIPSLLTNSLVLCLSFFFNPTIGIFNPKLLITSSQTLTCPKPPSTIIKSGNTKLSFKHLKYLR